MPKTSPVPRSRSLLRLSCVNLGGALNAIVCGGEEPVVLNFGDLFAYALAKRLALPLLFKGDDFARTDVQRVAI